MRKPNTKPTSIYWLVDIRPAVLVDWPNGLPFYCGKTVHSIARRLRDHRDAAKRHPERPSSARVLACGSRLRAVLMEIVPLGGDWVAREKSWIATLRHTFPDCTNLSEGGQGATGYAPTSETRAKLSAFKKGRPHSETHRRNLAAAQIGRIVSAETRERIRAAKAGKPLKGKHRARVIAANKSRYEAAHA